MKIFRGRVVEEDSFILSVRFTRRTATVTMSAPEAVGAGISWKLPILPVRRWRRELEGAPAITIDRALGSPRGCIPWGG